MTHRTRRTLNDIAFGIAVTLALIFAAVVAGNIVLAMVDDIPAPRMEAPR